MSQKHLNILINVQHKIVELSLYGESSGATLFEIADAKENGEAPIQIIEGCYYEFKITNGYSLRTSDIVSQSKVNDSAGRISPNIYVGTLIIDILNSEKIKCGEVKLEVRSEKTTYRKDYRLMLEEITEKCTDLLLQHSSPVSQYFEVNFNAEANTMYQRFAFIKSILESVEFNDSVNKVIAAPVTIWKESEITKDIRRVKRFNNSAIRQLINVGNRIDLPNDHPLKEKLQSIPSKIRVNNKTETVDAPENRFVKHALIYFQSFCSDFQSKLNESRIKNEAGILIDKLEQYLSHSIFKEISNPTTLPLNSPVLQRKEGYREIFRVWLMFDLAAKMVWHGGDDVYGGNKRDVAVLYEYWLFFKLLDIIKEVFKIDSLATEKLIEKTKDGLGLKLKQGKFLPIDGVYIAETRKLRIQFCYNKTFSGDAKYPDGGSWTRNLRPDYTLSIWPFGIEQEQAEIEELIVHIHFDAKYKMDDLQFNYKKDENLDEEKEEQKKGTYKRADILKMHTYRDAIRRTAGAYVLYPGSEQTIKQGFHEVLPGLGAFAIRPSKFNDGTAEFKKFLNEIVDHFMNRASQREKMSLKTYQSYQSNQNNELNESLPEAYGKNRNFFPDEAFVLIGYYKSDVHLKWIIENNLYNTRTGLNEDSLRLNAETAGAKYLLLYTEEENQTNKLYKLNEKGPRLFLKEEMILKAYPDPRHEFYLVYDLIEGVEKEFEFMKWNVSEFDEFKNNSKFGLPFSVSISKLMGVLVK